MKKILVACGTSIATSTVVALKLKEIFEERNIAARVDQCKVSEVPSKAEGYDLIISTTQVSGAGDVPVIQTISFLTGIGMESDVEKIIAMLQE